MIRCDEAVLISLAGQESESAGAAEAVRCGRKTAEASLHSRERSAGGLD